MTKNLFTYSNLGLFQKVGYLDADKNLKNDKTWFCKCHLKGDVHFSF